ncbi:MAG: radical SAM protein [Desulfocapsaceae bacterium]|nr:radical SAM protein [Desulfocapsaceae bacterium]
MSILLINPPTAKLSEPPAGIARLAGSLREKEIFCITCDLNLECMLDLFTFSCAGDDTWSKRAYNNRFRHLQELRSMSIYQQPDRYLRAVKDLNRTVSTIGRAADLELSLANFSAQNRSPLKSSDLLDAAEKYHESPFFPIFSRRLEELLERHSFDFIGISFSYLSQVISGFAILGYIRKQAPALKTVAGGGVITSWMSSPAWKNRFSSYIDHLVKGPGEKPLLELMGTAPDPLPGTPDYSDFDFAGYLAPGPILPYAASDGCYWKKCTFCPDHAENSCYSQISREQVHDDITTLISRHKPVLLHFLDNAMSPALMRSLSKYPPNLPWYGFSRFEHDLENTDFCYALRKSGCVMLKLGLESGSQKVLDRLNKGIHLDRVETILANLERAGIATYIYLLFGTPCETETEAYSTLEFVAAHHSSITFLNLALFNMPICSPEASALPDRFSNGDLSLYCNFDHPSGWDRKSVRLFLHNHFRKNPRITTIIKRDPAFFTSNHAPFFCPGMQNNS